MVMVVVVVCVGVLEVKCEWQGEEGVVRGRDAREP
jgi:hypothetical protein